MSIRIERSQCHGCGRCREVCPGGLIRQDEAKKAYIKEPRDCWGCAACLKECDFGAIRYFLGPDIGGRGAYLTVKNEPAGFRWLVVKDCRTARDIRLNRNEANKY